MSVVTFNSYTPLARKPPLTTPWTQIKIEQAPPDAPHTWTQIDLFDIVPLDADPANPVSRSFSTRNATLDAAWYRVTFLDAEGDSEPTTPVFNSVLPGPGPRNGPCSPWVSGDAVAASPWVKKAIETYVTGGAGTQDQAAVICADSATAASEVLYEMSGRVFTGLCGPVTVRPVWRPTDSDTRGIGVLSPLGWFGAMAGSSWSGSWPDGTLRHYGGQNPPEVQLWSGPVTEITEVKIDGVVIPADEYQLQDFGTLVRIRPTADAVPTERWGWPTSQLLDLPDTEQGTFSVTYTYGQPPPTSGVLAARKLAEYLALPQLGDTTKYPSRVTSVQRQGVTSMVVDVMDIVKTGKTGIYEVDLFLRSVNPTQAARQASVWSPDVGRARRTPTT